MTDKNDYLIKLFDEYNEVLEHCNKPCKNMYSKDEFWARHRIFKELQNDMRSYSYMVFIQNLKQKIRNFKDKFRRKKRKSAECIAQSEQANSPGQTVQSEQANSHGQTVQSEQANSPGQTVQSEQAISPGQTVQSEQAISPRQKVKKRRGRPRKIK